VKSKIVVFLRLTVRPPTVYQDVNKLVKVIVLQLLKGLLSQNRWVLKQLDSREQPKRTIIPVNLSRRRATVGLYITTLTSLICLKYYSLQID